MIMFQDGISFVTCNMIRDGRMDDECSHYKDNNYNKIRRWHYN